MIKETTLCLMILIDWISHIFEEIIKELRKRKYTPDSYMGTIKLIIKLLGEEDLLKK